MNPRHDLAVKHVRGTGFEVGAGDNPFPNPNQAKVVYVDNTDAVAAVDLFHFDKERLVSAIHDSHLPQAFPATADFFVSSNVLEHTPDPIGALSYWMGRLHDRGHMIIAVPNASSCADAGRIVPDFDHVVLDHLLERGEHSFETREHVYSMQLSWSRTGYPAFDDVHTFVNAIQHNARHSFSSAYHYHAFDTELLKAIIEAAGYFAGHHVELVELIKPEHAAGEIIAVASIDRNSSYRHRPTIARLHTLHGKVDKARKRLPAGKPRQVRKSAGIALKKLSSLFARAK